MNFSCVKNSSKLELSSLSAFELAFQIFDVPNTAKARWSLLFFKNNMRTVFEPRRKIHSKIFGAFSQIFLIILWPFAIFEPITGYEGTYPNCAKIDYIPPATTQRPTPPPQCPAGTTGRYPNCQRPTPPPTPAPRCAPGLLGKRFLT